MVDTVRYAYKAIDDADDLTIAIKLDQRSG